MGEEGQVTVGTGLAMVATMLAGALWGVPTGEVVLEGKATHYAEGRMMEVVGTRGLSLEGYAGGVALNRAGDLGRKVWLEWDGGPYSGLVDGPFLVVDCAQRGEHYERRQRRGYVVEVDAVLAGLRGFKGWGPVGVRVWFVDPRAESWGAI